MAKDSAKLERAVNVYQRFVATLREKGWNFDAKDDDLVIVSSYQGDDFPINFIFHVDPDRECITFCSEKFAKFPDDKLSDAAYATAVANHGMTFGHFDLDLSDGSVFYAWSDSYIDSELGDGYFIFLLSIALSTVDRYNDRFIMLAKGLIDLRKFIEIDG